MTIRCALLLILVLGVSREASAAAIFSLTASSLLTFDLAGAPLDGVIIGNDFGSSNGNGTFSTDLSAAGVIPVSAVVSASGSSLPASAVFSTGSTSHVISIDNRVGDNGQVPFTFTYSWLITLGVDDPTLETALAGVLFQITSGPGGLVVVNGESDYTFTAQAATALGETGTMGSVVVNGGFLVGFASVAQFTIFTDFGGAAFPGGAQPPVTPVPEPGSVLLLASGLLVTWRHARARRPAAAQ
jgi:hypothetical protein